MTWGQIGAIDDKRDRRGGRCLLIGGALGVIGVFLGVWSVGPVAAALAVRPHVETVYSAPFDSKLPLTAGAYAIYESPRAQHVTPDTVSVDSSDERTVPTVDSFERLREDQSGRTFEMAVEFVAPADGLFRRQVDAPAGTTFIVSENRHTAKAPARVRDHHRLPNAAKETASGKRNLRRSVKTRPLSRRMIARDKNAPPCSRSGWRCLSAWKVNAAWNEKVKPTPKAHQNGGTTRAA